MAADDTDELAEDELAKWMGRVQKRKGLAFLKHEQTGQSALIAGIRRSCCIEKLRILLQHRDCAKCGDKSGLPLHIAIQVGSKADTLTVLVNTYPDALKVPDVQTRLLPLHMMLDNESFNQETVSVCRLMLEFYPEAAQISCNDRLAFHICLERHLPWELTELVLSKNRCAAATPTSGMLPLHTAVLHNLDSRIISSLIAAHPRALLLEMPGSGRLPVEYAIEKKAHTTVILSLMSGVPSGPCADPRAVAYACASTLGLVTETPRAADVDCFSHRVVLQVVLQNLPLQAVHMDAVKGNILEELERSVRDSMVSLPAGYRVELLHPELAGGVPHQAATPANMRKSGTLESASSKWRWERQGSLESMHSVASALMGSRPFRDQHHDRPTTTVLVLEFCIDTDLGLGERLTEELRLVRERGILKGDAEERIRQLLMFVTSPDYEGDLASIQFESAVEDFRVDVGEAQLTTMSIPIPIVPLGGDKFTLHMGLEDTVEDIKRRVRRRGSRAAHAQRLRLPDGSTPADRLACTDLVQMLADQASLEDGGGALRLEESHEFLHLALRFAVDDQIVDELLARGAHKVREADSEGVLPLHLAMLSGVSERACEQLLGCYPEAARAKLQGHGWYPLDLALDRRFGQSFVHALLGHVKPRDWTQDGFYNPEGARLHKKLRLPLHVAVLNGYPAATLKLIESSGCPLDAADAVSGQSLLDCALSCNRAEEVQTIFPHMMGSVGDVYDGSRRRLHQAVVAGAPESIVRPMCKKCGGEELLVRDLGGNLPIHLACAHGATLVIVNVLLEFCPDSARQPDRRGRLPIHLAVENQARPGVISALLAKDEGMVSAVAPCGRSLLELAAKVDAPPWVTAELVEHWPEDALEFSLLRGAWPRNGASADIHRLLREREEQREAPGALAEPGLPVLQRAPLRDSRGSARGEGAASVVETAAQGPPSEGAGAEEVEEEGTFSSLYNGLASVFAWS
ncbi:unnamed protein product [Prorocentrum cordatum]|uniref:Uncharacterized protein n=1 Tax=Prorocentrum cordatum TaxID=2364126 RepID=A0ABN9SDT5_9DINO|nr:unnamed protein product [Polarella glacialis]